MRFLMVQQEVRGGVDVPESDIVQSCRRVSSLLFLLTILLLHHIAFLIVSFKF